MESVDTHIANRCAAMYLRKEEGTPIPADIAPYTDRYALEYRPICVPITDGTCPDNGRYVLR